MNKIINRIERVIEMGFKNKFSKNLFKGFVLTQKAKYIIGISVLVLALIGGGVLWYVEENANKPGEATGIEEDDDTGLQVGESETQEDFENFEDDFINVNEDDSSEKKDSTTKKEPTKGPLEVKDDKEDDNTEDDDKGTSDSKDSGWGRLF